VFNAPSSLPAYATVFEEMNALQHFEAFCSENGPRFYGLPLNEGTITLVRKPWKVADSIALGEHTLVPFLAGETLNWTVEL
jgi:dihydroorotase